MLLASLLQLLCTIAGAQTIKLTTGELRLRAPLEPDDTAGFARATAQHSKYHFVIRAGGTAPAVWEKRGLRLSARLADSVYVVVSEMLPTADWCRQLGISAIGFLNPELKMEPRLAKRDAPGHAREGSGILLWGLADDEQELPAIRQWVESLGGEWREPSLRSPDLFACRLPAGMVRELAAFPPVLYLQYQPPPERSLNQNGRSQSAAMLMQAPVSDGGRGLLGNGVTLGVGDDADPSLHPDHSDRIINHSIGVVNDHGAHVTGTVGGAGILGARFAGFAPASMIVAQFFTGILNNAPAYAQAYGMAATNNSYGAVYNECDYAGVYDLTSRTLDQISRQMPDMLHVFASGNDGDNTCAPFPTRYRTVLGAFQSAKNVITVGRTDYNQQASGSSSSGPARDGRLKPEITALGIIESTNGAGTGYFGAFGTSMAAPSVTGGLGLLIERYRQLHGGANPPGEALKAMLLNGARDAGNAGPDFRHGFGTMHLTNSLRMLEAGNWYSDEIATGQTIEIPVNVPPGLSRLQALLCWHDMPAVPFAPRTLVHDLDLELVAPDGRIILPRILNPAPNAVTQPAGNGVDRLNNVEQVLAETPAPGVYRLRVRGHDIGMAPRQSFGLAWDLVPGGIRWNVPLQGQVWPSGVTGFPAGIPLSWDDATTSTGVRYTIEYSPDDGNTWFLANDQVTDLERMHWWTPAQNRGTTGRMRITKPGHPPVVSGRFALVPYVNFQLAPAAEQCEGYIKINWTALPEVSGQSVDYEIRMKQGPVMAAVAHTTGLTYTLSGLHRDSTYYVAVVARINGVAGSYDRAAVRRPNTGSCTGNISDGDLRIDSLLGPRTGRQFSGSQPSGPVIIRIRNLDNEPTGRFAIRYRINGGPFAEAVITTPIPALGTYTHNFAAPNLSATGDYLLEAVVQHLDKPDPVASNDSLRTLIRHLPNPPIDLTNGWREDFETAPVFSRQGALTGIPGLDRWDFAPSDAQARLRTLAAPGVALSGNRAITLDAAKAPPYATNPVNLLLATLNLSGYANMQSEVRLAFHYKAHGPSQQAHPANRVWVRASDTDNWIEIFNLHAAQAAAGQWREVPNIELNDPLLSAGRTFGPTTQVRFGQYGLRSMSDNFRQAGYTFDDVRLFLAANDAAVMEIVSPNVVNCGLGGSTPVIVRVRNTMPQPLPEVIVSYRVDNGPWISDTLRNLPGKTTLTHTFRQPANLAGVGRGSLFTRVQSAGDNVAANDTLSLSFLNLPVVNSFPYLEDFENGPGGFQPNGRNSSWAFGTPAAFAITSAASGLNAWKTSLRDYYNNNELSYLYTPCFQTGSMTKPMLSFHMASQIEDCRNINEVCDLAWVEYTTNGTTWQKLGAAGQGLNWYDFEPQQAWMREDRTHWKATTIPLPAGQQVLQFRFVLQTDEGYRQEGLAIDDVHVYDGIAPIFTGPTPAPVRAALPLQGTLTVQYPAGIAGSLARTGAGDAEYEVQPILHPRLVRGGNQWLAARNWTVWGPQEQDPPVRLRWYFTDREVDSLRRQTGAVVPADVTRLGLLRYTYENSFQYDSSWRNNEGGTWTPVFHPPLRIVPYDSGYYAEAEVTAPGEYWLGAQEPGAAPAQRFRVFEANTSGDLVQLRWTIENPLPGDSYELWVAQGTEAARQQRYSLLTTVPGTTAADYTYADIRAGLPGTRVYRLVQKRASGEIFHSQLRRVSLLPDKLTLTVHPNPTMGPVSLGVFSARGQTLQLRLLSVDGRITWQQSLPVTGPEIQVPLQLPSGAKGLYLLEARDGEQRAVIRILSTR